MIEQFAAIIGLLSAFSAGRDSKASLNISEFEAWLAKHNHEEILRSLNSNAKTNIFVKAYLNNEIPEIQGKLDSIIASIQLLASEQETTIAGYSGNNFLKGVLRLALERIIDSGLTKDDFDIAYFYTLDMLEDTVFFNKAALESMVRDCLLRKSSVSKILSLHWLDLVGTH